MEEIIKKLNFKDQVKVLILNCPDDLNGLVKIFEKHSKVDTTIRTTGYPYALIFATQKAMIDELSPLIDESLVGDAILWFAYPKGTSKKYKCDFNRDTGWEALGKFNFEPVRQVAIDQDWSALRFRRVNYIKKMTRNEKMIISEEGKSKKSKKE